MRPQETYERAVKLGTAAHAGKTWAAGQPYTSHLAAVEQNIRKFCQVPPAILDMLCAAAWLHDAVEDVGMTLERIEQECGPEVRTLVWAVTDEPCPNRKARHERTFPKIKNVAFAVALKLADRIANVEVNAPSRGGMFEMYRSEHADFKKALYVAGQNEEMWSHLDKLLAEAPSKAAVKMADALVAFLRAEHGHSVVVYRESGAAHGSITLDELHRRFASIVQANLKQE